jgi:hypothetical protein
MVELCRRSGVFVVSARHDSRFSRLASAIKINQLPRSTTVTPCNTDKIISCPIQIGFESRERNLTFIFFVVNPLFMQANTCNES